MNVVIHPDGRVEYTNVTMEQALKLANAVIGGNPSKRRVSRGVNRGKRGRPPTTTDVNQLTEIQAQTWQWLVANDKEEGCSPSDYAAAANIKRDAANARLTVLSQMGLARLVGIHLYRPGAA